MAKRRTAAAEATNPEDVSFDPSTFDRQDQAAEIVQSVAEHAQMPPDVQPAGHAARHAARGHIANPSGRSRPPIKLPSAVTIAAGDLKVEVVDKGVNSAGIGVRVVLPEGRELSADEKDAIRNVMNEPNGQYPSGYKYNGLMWHKDIGADTPGYIAGAIRADAESRATKLADALRELQPDAPSFAEREQHRRELATERTPG